MKEYAQFVIIEEYAMSMEEIYLAVVLLASLV